MSTKVYEILVRTTEVVDNEPGKPGVRIRNHHITIAELMDLIDDEQARQIKETMEGVGDDESRS